MIEMQSSLTQGSLGMSVMIFHQEILRNGHIWYVMLVICKWESHTHLTNLHTV